MYTSQSVGATENHRINLSKATLLTVLVVISLATSVDDSVIPCRPASWRDTSVLWLLTMLNFVGNSGQLDYILLADELHII